MEGSEQGRGGRSDHTHLDRSGRPARWLPDSHPLPGAQTLGSPWGPCPGSGHTRQHKWSPSVLSWSLALVSCGRCNKL